MREIITLRHLEAVLNHVGENGSITNRECRVVTGLGYDSSIKMFSALRTMGMLHRTGQSSSTKYILSPFITGVDQLVLGKSDQPPLE